MRALLLALCVIAPPVLAADTLSPEEFDAYTRGHTFTYGSQGMPYGTEQYLDNRRVRWSFLDGRCQEGEWYEDGGLICFVYEDEPTPQCWAFRRGAAGLVARFANDPSLEELYEVERSDKPLSCPGPDVGV
ncbi:hypothetical protein DC366_09920 [Pelagivirga sediminicola]|uniref:DUF995 domain-containing protein n=1 Tax=Pelagivirga sediminicola TaxID=2170575 RepID=A0A2T7G6D7_9RHOB|nr:hypothetical protein [Pelagivirga sediminicola]PVA09980.1 hypothetical protein DC366_09920 [Pelagivirga sediminicola]